MRGELGFQSSIRLNPSKPTECGNSSGSSDYDNPAYNPRIVSFVGATWSPEKCRKVSRRTAGVTIPQTRINRIER
jgi:hypothetical protein